MLGKEGSLPLQQHCRNCGATVRSGADFCVSCGERLEDRVVVNKLTVKRPKWGWIGLVVLLAGTVPAILINSLLVLQVTDPLSERNLFLFLDFVFHLLPLPLGALAGLAWPGTHPKGYALLGLLAGAIELIVGLVFVSFYPISLGIEDSLAVLGTIVLFILGAIFVDLPQQPPKEELQEDRLRRVPRGWQFHSPSNRRRWPPTRRQALMTAGIIATLIALLSVSYFADLPGLGHAFQHAFWIIVIVEVLAVLVTLMAIGSRYGWTGFGNKNLWDWLQLLIIPFVLAVGTFFFTLVQSNRSKATEEIRSQDTAVQNYLDQMSRLELTKDQEQSAVRLSYAQSHTDSVLWRLDTTIEMNNRKALVLNFLYRNGLIGTPQGIINLDDAHLTDAFLGNIDLPGTDLRGVDLRGSELPFTNLSGADLRGAYLGGTNLWKANLKDADMRGAVLVPDRALFAISPSGIIKPNLSDATLEGTRLEGVNLSEVNGLTQEQIEETCGDADTQLPYNLTRPSWKGCS